MKRVELVNLIAILLTPLILATPIVLAIWGYICNILPSFLSDPIILILVTIMSEGIMIIIIVDIYTKILHIQEGYQSI